MTQSNPNDVPVKRRSRVLAFAFAVVLTAAITFALTGLLMSIFQRKQEAKNPYVRLVEVDENTTDPAKWGINWPKEYDSYRRTVDVTRTKFGGSEALPAEKIERDPWMKRMFAGYAFSIDYRDRRGHAYMMQDQEKTDRVTKRPQPGACLHCHASIIPAYREIGKGDVMKGFELISAMPYKQAHDLVGPDGKKLMEHPVSCVDCHNPKTMELRVTRPGFILGIQALAAGDAPVPHLQSIERWRKGSRAIPYDPNVDGTRQEMRSFACGQCHVEYYCGPKVTLFFPWNKGLKVEDIEATYDNFKFADGEQFYDWKHAETGAKVLKAQHPEFETWSQGVHARSGVACADCHMPYVREGATKISDHHVRSPMLNVARACQTCHHYPEAEIQARVDVIQNRTHKLMEESASALMDMLDAYKSAKATGATDDELKPVQKLQRHAQWRLDFVAAENSMGFHAPPETARILAEAIDYARQGQIEAYKLSSVVKPATMPVTMK